MVEIEIKTNDLDVSLKKSYKIRINDKHHEIRALYNKVNSYCIPLIGSKEEDYRKLKLEGNIYIEKMISELFSLISIIEKFQQHLEQHFIVIS